MDTKIDDHKPLACKKTMIIKDMNESVWSSFLYFMGEGRERWETGANQRSTKVRTKERRKKTQLGSSGGATKNHPTWAQGQRSKKPPDLGPGVVREKPPDSLERAGQGQGQRARAKLG